MTMPNKTKLKIYFWDASLSVSKKSQKNAKNHRIASMEEPLSQTKPNSR
jgi:hypothetical protein